MPYIGNQPSESFTSFATQEFSTSATTSYTLDHAVTNENEIALFVNNVRQQPGSGKAYTASGTALTLSAATASTDTMYCVFLGRALQTVTPATNSITAAMVGNDLISGKTALGETPADTDELLVSDAGTLKRVDFSHIKGGGITNAQEFLLTSNKSGTNSTDDFITSNISENATASYGAIGSNVSQSSGVFSFSATGIYLVTFEITGATSSTDDFDASIDITTDNSTFENRARKWFNPRTSEPDKFQGTVQTIVDVSNTTNVKIKFNIGPTNPPSSNVTFYGSSTEIMTGFRFIRLGDT